MSRWDGLNRRKFPRVNYPCLVVINQSDGSPNDVILTHTENIGIGGVCVILKQAVAMFSFVKLELDLMDLGNHIKCKGKVVWSVRRKNEMEKKPSFYDLGIEFVELDIKDQARLEEVVKNLVKNNKQSILS